MANINRAGIAEKLRKLRGNRPVEEIALYLGVTSSAVMMYERGDRVPKDTVKVKYAELTGISVQTLFFED